MAKLTQEDLERYVINEVTSACDVLGVAYRELSPEYVEALRQQLAAQFGPGADYLLTFDNMLGKNARQDTEGWALLQSFLNREPHLLFYDAPGSIDRHGVRFLDGSAIPKVLAECFGFPFYITDEAHRFVVGMNEHDYLIGVGSAEAWMRGLPAREE